MVMLDRFFSDPSRVVQGGGVRLVNDLEEPSHFVETSVCSDVEHASPQSFKRGFLLGGFCPRSRKSS